ncbi:FAD-dependent oxidoreductase [Geodermatophilus sp. YIM 151500]|uniref:FAD-dependent oxidoreductase n=1 Tax=Geodermatophilus sp. YIM 151500 TaxID=2984531 RepID=UPI0021E40F27|nr:FAD-dependent oxidoreductase [Geodermatophilus sp. YIM 151500]MCV2489327.1 FAD-dependent oxidoreductase [Geodermatophilus sp. YIM 151500]
MSTIHSDTDVLVVGGGIGGLATALALTRTGLRVRLLERAPEFGEVGAGMQIAPNATRILDAWGLLPEVLSLGVQPGNLVMRDGVDGTVLTRLDLADVRRRYGSPYVVIHRSDLHGILLRACRRGGVDLVNGVQVTGYEHLPQGVAVLHAGGAEVAPVVVAADGLYSVARRLISDDEPVSSAYVAYRGAIPAATVANMDVSMSDVVVHVGPHSHFVQYPLRSGEMFNQVAVFRSPRALAGEEGWGTPDELDAAFAGCSEQVRAGLPLMWRDRWWRMYDRDPIPSWVQGRLALTGDAAHPPLQYLAQGAVMALEDAWVLAEHVRAGLAAGRLDWDAALAAYDAVRPEHCRRVVTTARSWGELWHLTGAEREARNAFLRQRDVRDYGFVDWLYGPTALTPGQEPAMFTPQRLALPVGA